MADRLVDDAGSLVGCVKRTIFVSGKDLVRFTHPTKPVKTSERLSGKKGRKTKGKEQKDKDEDRKALEISTSDVPTDFL